jgi:hypothetical protein
MIKRLFFDRINMHRTGPCITECFQSAADVDPVPAFSRFPFGKRTAMRAELTHDHASLAVPETGRHIVTGTMNS